MPLKQVRVTSGYLSGQDHISKGLCCVRSHTHTHTNHTLPAKHCMFVVQMAA